MFFNTHIVNLKEWSSTSKIISTFDGSGEIPERNYLNQRVTRLKLKHC